MQHPPTIPNLTMKQRQFLAGLSRGLTQTEAARQAGYEFPAVAASKMMRSETLKEYNRAILEGAGVTPETIAGSIRDGIGAVRSLVVTVDGPGGKARRVEIVEPDYHARFKFIELAVKMMGLQPLGEMVVRGGGEAIPSVPQPNPPPPTDSPFLKLSGKELLAAMLARGREMLPRPVD